MPANYSFKLLTAACASDPKRIRFGFVDESSEVKHLSGEDVISRSEAFGIGLQEISREGDRILLPYPAGLDFIVGFLGCIAANRIPVPANYPKPRRPSSRYQAIADNCQAAVAITDSRSLLTLDRSKEAGLKWFSAEEIERKGAASCLKSRAVGMEQTNVRDGVDKPTRFSTSDRDEVNESLKTKCIDGMAPSDLLFLQYTSGSTSNPKGVMITAANLFSNLRAISHGFGLDQIPASERIVCSWLPAYHDMGLVGVILSTLMHDGQAVLMAPTTFLRRPSLWLESIERYKARITVSPCFGYQWATSRIAAEEAANLDLSSLKLAACGAEPISPDVLVRFADHFQAAGFCKSAFYPCYGLAEATLMVSGDHRGGSAPSTTNRLHPQMTLRLDRSQLRQHVAVEASEASEASEAIEIVHCGQVSLSTEIAILSQLTGEPAGDGEVGEILVSSPSVASGYWGAAESTRETFQFRFPGQTQSYLRTGDLGFLLHNRLYVTGRNKELIIIAGQNLYPHDIEQTIAACHSALKGYTAAAFAVRGDATEQLVVVQEVPRGLDETVYSNIMRKIRLSVATTHDLAPHAVVLVRPASIPKTSSGKVQRLRTGEEYRENQLKVAARWELKSQNDRHQFRDITTYLRSGNTSRLRTVIETTLLRWVAANTGEAPEFVSPDQSFAELGVDSLLTVQLAQEVEQWLGCRISPVAAWSYPTPARMADFLVGQLDSSLAAFNRPSECNSTKHMDAVSEASHSLAAMLAELEQMDDSQAQALLGQPPH